MTSQQHVIIYTDGACIGNPGPGGYGAVLEYGKHRRELSGGYSRTTNNRMELMGPIKSLEALKVSCRVTLYSDSKYVVDAVEKGWAKRWQANGWMRNKKEQAINPDLWGRLLDPCANNTMLSFAGYVDTLATHRTSVVTNWQHKPPKRTICPWMRGMSHLRW